MKRNIVIAEAMSTAFNYLEDIRLRGYTPVILEAYIPEGYARKLMDELLRRAATVFLEVRAGNEAAIGLYTHSGFQEIDRRKNYYHDPEEDAVVMRKG